MNSINDIDAMNSNENIMHIRASEIIKIFASPENRHSFATENSKNILYNV